MADKRISQLVDRGTVVNNDVIPIVVSGATTTNKATISSIQTFMQGNLDVGVTSVGITLGSTGTDVNVSGSPVTSSGNITINIPSASATNRGLVTTGSQTFAGAKTFNSDLIVNGITVGKGGASNGNNTAIGANSLSSNTTGTLNTATGISSLQYNTGGNSNTANGANSLVANTTGGFNTASGNQSLYSNTTGQANTAIGLNSLYSNTTGTYNIGVGSGAGYYIADGSTPNTTSDFSIYLGADTKASIDGAQNEVVIGYNAIGNGSNTVTIGNSSNTENYFTGNVRGLSFQVAAAGTANPIIIRNTSGTSSTTSNTNVIGFNSVNNIFVTTHSRGGFILGFNNSVSNREYTLPDASGTVALTSNLSAYLPLAGGTLTGALNGTSASFTGNAQADFFTVGTTAATSGGLRLGTQVAIRARNVGNTANIPLIESTSTDGVSVSNGALILASTGAATFSGNAFISKASPLLVLNDTSGSGAQIGSFGGNLNLIDNATGTKGMVMSLSTGAATFSSSVTATSFNLGNGQFLRLTRNSGGLQYDALGIVAGTDNTRLISTGDFDVVNGSLTSQLKVAASGNVGIGTASPDTFSYGGNRNFLTLRATATNQEPFLQIIANGVGNSLIDFGNESIRRATIIGENGSNLAFYTNGTNSGTVVTERMRITSGGFLKASNGVFLNSAGSYHELNSNINNEYTVYVNHVHGTNPQGVFCYFSNAAPNNTNSVFFLGYDTVGTKFEARANGGIANFQANNVNLSDERTKKDIEPLESYWDKFKAIEIVKFKYKDQTHDDFNIGVIAQQVEVVAPEFVDVDGWNKPELDEEGNEIVSEEEPLKAIYTADLYHATIKVLQEAMAKIEKLETEIDSLKNQIK